MKAESKFLLQPLDFWANVKLISQSIGYTQKKAKNRKGPQVKVPSIDEIKSLFIKRNLDISRLYANDKLTTFGELLIEYFQYRADILNNYVEPNLMTANQAKQLFKSLKTKLKPKCPLPLNKQKGEKSGYAYFTGIINMLIEANINGNECDFSPSELTSFTLNRFPIRSLSRRIDGTFPSVINPIAIWEIKEYYYTTTFGSRIADGVYETLLDGYELDEVRRHLNRGLSHYLMLDAYDTWWLKGRSYLCRIIDMLHMGLLTEALFGKEIVTRIPIMVEEWLEELNKAPKR